MSENYWWNWIYFRDAEVKSIHLWRDFFNHNKKIQSFSIPFVDTQCRSKGCPVKATEHAFYILRSENSWRWTQKQDVSSSISYTTSLTSEHFMGSKSVLIMIPCLRPDFVQAAYIPCQYQLWSNHFLQKQNASVTRVNALLSEKYSNKQLQTPTILIEPFFLIRGNERSLHV